MSKRNRSQAHGRGAAARREKRKHALPWSVRLRSMSDLLLHPAPPEERPWKFLLPVLALAFVARAAIALSGDFVLHPDEVMQYLEPAHRLVFGNGVTYWEYFYGARSWLVPGLVAGVLKLFDIVGLGQPFWYVGGVKLVFCAISLLIPAGMYFFARWHFGETVARVSLLMGAFWYELVGFAHKPMTEFVATALLMSLLALCVRPASDKLRMVLTAALLAVLVAAIRVQYAPLALTGTRPVLLAHGEEDAACAGCGCGFRRCRRIRRDHVGWWVVSLLPSLYSTQSLPRRPDHQG